jgi:hypothetical protein
MTTTLSEIAADVYRISTYADLQPQTLAVMHGASFSGDGARALRDLARVVRELLGGP